MTTLTKNQKKRIRDMYRKHFQEALEEYRQYKPMEKFASGDTINTIDEEFDLADSALNYALDLIEKLEEYIEELEELVQI